MKTYRKELWFEIPTRRAFINITPDIQECINDSGVTKVEENCVTLLRGGSFCQNFK